MLRRNLQFRKFDEVIDDVRSLQQTGYNLLGNWSLGQICDHLAIFFRGSLDGFGEMYPWIVRATVGKYFLWKILNSGKMTPGIKVPKRFLPGNVREDSAAAEELVKLIKRFEEKPDPLEPSPFFGPLFKEQWTRLHLIHAAHHLSFLAPKV
jgi:hypothetical protein